MYYIATQIEIFYFLSHRCILEIKLRTSYKLTIIKHYVRWGEIQCESLYNGYAKKA